MFVGWVMGVEAPPTPLNTPLQEPTLSVRTTKDGDYLSSRVCYTTMSETRISDERAERIICAMQIICGLAYVTQHDNTSSCAALAMTSEQQLEQLSHVVSEFTTRWGPTHLHNRQSMFTQSDNVNAKRDVRRSIKLANFCKQGLVAPENRPIKSSNHNTRPILSFATAYDIR